MKVLLAGVSTRAAAESAARAGFAVTAIDAFADLDQHPDVRAHSLGHRFSPTAAANLAQTISCEAVVYGSNFENHPDAVSLLAGGRALWGNSSDVIRRVRDPRRFAEALRKRGFASPALTIETRSATPKSRARWLVKRYASGGGHGIRPWRRGDNMPRRGYLQEFIDGPPGSIVFVASRGRATAIGFTRQLVGEEAFGASGYRYCGNILTAWGDQDDVVPVAIAIADAVSEDFGLVGVNGIDLVVHKGVPYALEVNPRWCASMELVERAYGLSVFAAHAAACRDGVLPDFNLVRARSRGQTVGKAIVFARRTVTVGDTRVWRAEAAARDLPRVGTTIPAGRPVCTVFGAGDDAAACHADLVRLAELVYAQL